MPRALDATASVGRANVISKLRQWTSATAQSVRGPDRAAHLRVVVEAVLIGLLLLQAGRLVWIVVDPKAPSMAPLAQAQIKPADLNVFQRFDAFFRTGGLSSLADVTNADTAQLRLFGVRSGGAGDGSAIIGLADGRQVSVGVGEEVEPGLVLKEVGQDYVTLARSLSVSRLVFSEVPVGAPPPPPPPPGEQVVGPAAPASAPSAPAAAVDPSRLMAQASLRPRMQGMAIKGFTVSGSGDQLAAAGLQAGDVILSVNGNELTGLDRIAALRGQLANSANAEVRFERAGQVQTTTIRTTR
ncbi:general secretion pathway protein C [Brevundimonas sp. UYEF29]|uniref:type II secretion system protein N n=1 Tax=Brevundimonas sp. UYEF29 TaxID=3156346 RepID=UPI00339877EA